ncbi:MAG: BatD family protein, partial [Nitrospinae bacterium]|nr:BatD family protein [Nitrospinota bacterium]
PFGDFFNDPLFSGPFGRGNLIEKTTVSNANLLEVITLPKDKMGDPAMLVGNYYLSESLSKKELKTGESTTLTISISGDGNLNLFDLPEIKIDSVKSYKDKPVVTKSIQGDKIIFSKEFKIAIIPEKKGVISIPVLQIPYYNIFDNTWSVLRGKELSLNVSEGITGQINPDNDAPALPVIPRQQTLNRVGEDILPIYTGDSLYANVNIDDFLIEQLYGLIFLTVFFISLLFYYYRSYLPSSDTKYLKRTKAFSNANERLGKAVTLDDISGAVKQFIGDKSGNPGISFTIDEIKELFNRHQVEEMVRKDIILFLEKLEAALYGGESLNELNKVKNNAKELIRQINRSL